ncbi:MAG: hypothetical protein P3X22_007120 [Thermoprotei archaeon]|nr:hypothetical protein [Thermoprotei archaeon]
MTSRFKISETARWIIYIGLSIVLAVASILFILWSLGYMERGYVATSLLSALAGFTLLSASLYALRLSAYVYAMSKGESEGEKGR